MGTTEAASAYAEERSEGIATTHRAWKRRAVPEQEVLGKPLFLLGVGQAVESVKLRAGGAVLLAREAPSA
jgi:hypothetical protein